MLVVDIDPDRGGIETLARLEGEYGALPRSWEVATGGGGQHLYFSVPYDVEIVKPDRWKADGVEIKHEGHYVIGPGSNHVSGKRYTQTSSVGDRPPIFPAKWLELVSIFTPVSDAHSTSKPASRSPSAGKPALSTWHKRSTHKSDKSAEHVEQAPSTDSSDNSDNYSIVSDISDISVCSAVREKIIEAVKMTYPRRKGIRNLKLMELGRWLFRIEELQEKDAEWFRPIIKLWLDLAQQWIGPREFAETWAEWLDIWTLWVSRSIDDHPVFKANELMKKRQTPPLPPNGYRSDNARRLVALCAALADVAADADGIFFVSCRDAARVIGLDPEEYCRFVGSVFRQMTKDGILEKVGEHKRGSMKAQRYKYHQYTPAPANVEQAAA